jgi:hypothetical protein
MKSRNTKIHKEDVLGPEGVVVKRTFLSCRDVLVHGAIPWDKSYPSHTKLSQPYKVVLTIEFLSCSKVVSYRGKVFLF